jgi:paraquat-inducible protein B
MRTANSTDIGLFIAGGVLAFIAAIFLFVAGSVGRANHCFVLYFDESVHGLDIGAPVKMRGVRVGQVRKIAPFFDSLAGKVRTPVIIALQDRHFGVGGGKSGVHGGGFFAKFCPGKSKKDLDLLPPVAGLVGSLQVESFVTGKLFVDLCYAPTKATEPQAGSDGPPEIPTRPSEVRNFNDHLIAVAESLSHVDYAAIGRALEQILSSMAAVEWRDLARSVGATSEAVAQTLGGEDMRLALRSAAATCQNLEEFSGHLVNATFPLLDEAREVCQKFAAAAISVKNFLDDGAPIPLELAQFLRQTGAAAQAVQIFFEFLDQKPNALLFGKTKKERR